MGSGSDIKVRAGRRCWYCLAFGTTMHIRAAHYSKIFSIGSFRMGE
jgi:hypothetical protein